MVRRARAYQQCLPAGCLHRQGAGRHTKSDSHRNTYTYCHADTEGYTSSEVSPHAAAAPVTFAYEN